MNVLLVVENLKSWPLDTSGAQVITARDYLTKPEYARMKSAKVFNLCRSYKYQSMGYYVSLLAAARGHKALPRVSTILDMRNSALVRLASEDLNDQINHLLAPLVSDQFALSVYFGSNLARRYDRLSAHLFRMFPMPLMRAFFARDDNGWRMRQLVPIPTSEIPDSHMPFVVEMAREFFSKKRIPSAGYLAERRYALAIMHDPEAPNPPSNKKALSRFQKAAEKVGFSVELLTREDAGRIAEFDALFIREDTNITQPIYRIARRAQAEGLVVIDDPSAILRTMNKVYLAEALSRAKIPMPRTEILSKDNYRDAIAKVGLPCILKQPDSAFSRGVVKAETQDELEQRARALFERSELIIAQEFLPSAFDWRIGVINNEPLYACKYYMARKHWQIVKRDGDGGEDWGRTETLPLWQVPPPVVDSALRAAALMGDGLFGVDLKEIDGKPYVIEVNDNPDIWGGIEDAVLKDELYLKIMQVFLDRVERHKEGKIRK